MEGGRYVREKAQRGLSRLCGGSAAASGRGVCAGLRIYGGRVGYYSDSRPIDRYCATRTASACGKTRRVACQFAQSKLRQANAGWRA